MDKSNPPGIDPHHFFGGGVCREEATSAFLATLLEQSAGFRSRFFKVCGINEFALEKVEVEKQSRDITISGADVEVIIENKIDGASKQVGQLLRYYTQLKEQNPEITIHSVYLSPDRNLGKSEVEQLPKMHNEIAVSIAWKDLEPHVIELTDIDSLFAEKGMESVLQAIRNRRVRSSRHYSEDEDAIRKLLDSAAPQLILDFPDREICRFALQIWSYGDVTFYLSIESIAQNKMTTELSVNYQFKLRGKRRKVQNSQWPNAKRWFEKVKSNGEWNGFSLSSDNWMRREELIEAPHGNIVATIQKRFSKLLSKLENEI